MTPTALIEFRLFCTALGFTAVVIQGGQPSKKDGALRAKTFAGLIEVFCRETVPEAFSGSRENNGESAPSETDALRDRMIAAIVGIIETAGECIPKDLLARGFTPVEVERHWPMAHALAKVQLDIKDS